MAKQVIVTTNNTVQVAIEPTPNVDVTISRTSIGTVANVLTANYANFAGNAVHSNTANTVTNNAQPNITSVGTLTNLAISGDITTVDSITFDQAASEAYATAKMWWNTVDGTFNMGMYNNVTQQVGQELFFYGKAQGNITNGQVVMFAGVQGDHILLAPANASAPGFKKEYLVGIATQNINNGNFGYVTWFGKINDVNTNGFAAGSTLWFNPNVVGGLTDVEPTGNNIKVLMAAVIKAETSPSANNGILLVRPTFEPNINDIQGVKVTTPTNGQVLTYDSANSVWVNANVSANVSNVAYAALAGNANVAFSVDGSNVNGPVANANYADNAGNANVANIAYSVNVANVSGIGNIATINLDGNSSNVLHGDGTFAPEGSTGNANYANFAGNAFSVNGANVVGAVANATYAANAGYADNAGNANFANTATTSDTANIANIAYAVDVANVSGIGNIATINLTGNGDQTLLGNGTWGALPDTANANYANFAGQAFSVNGSNVTGAVANANYATSAGSAATAGSASTAGTVITAAQPNITSVGTLIDLNVNSNNDILISTNGANIVTKANSYNWMQVTNSSNSAGATVQQQYTNPVTGQAAYIGTSETGVNLSVVDLLSPNPFPLNVKSAWRFDNTGNLTHLIGGAGQINIKGANVTGNVIVSSNVNANVVNANYLYGDGSNISNINAANVNGLGNIASINLDGNASNLLDGTGNWVAIPTGGSSNYANFAGEVVNATQSNITQTGNLVSLTINNGVTDSTTIETDPALIALGSQSYVTKTTAYDPSYNLVGQTSNAHILYGPIDGYDFNFNGYFNNDYYVNDTVGTARGTRIYNGTFDAAIGNSSTDPLVPSSFVVQVPNPNSNLANVDTQTVTTFGIGNGAAGFNLVTGAPWGAPAFNFFVYGDESINNNGQQGLRFRRRNGNADARLGVIANNYLGNIEWQGGATATGGFNANSKSAKIAPYVDSSYGGPGTGPTPINLAFEIPNATATTTHTFYSNGNVEFNGTVNANTVNANTIGGELTTNSQPNITSVGNLTSLTINDGSSINTSVFQPAGTVVNSNSYISVNQRDISSSNGNDAIILNNASSGQVYSYDFLPSDGNTIVAGPRMEVTIDDNIGAGNVAVPGGITFTTYTNASNLTTGDPNLSTSFSVSQGVSFFTGAPFAGNAALFSTFNYGMNTNPSSSTLWRSTRRRGNGTSRLSLEPGDYLGNIEWRGAQAGGATPTGQRFAKIAPRVDSSYVANTAAQPVGIEFWVTDNTTARSQIFHANGNVTFSDAVNANTITANYLYGDGSNITGIAATNANYANFAGEVTNSAQPNITSVGTLIDLNVASSNALSIDTTNELNSNADAIRLTSTANSIILDSNSQIVLNAIASTSTSPIEIQGPTNSLTLQDDGNIDISSNEINIVGIVNGSTIKANYLYGDGSNITGISGGTPAGSNTQIQFNDSGSFGASTELTFDNASNVLYTSNIDVGGGNITINSDGSIVVGDQIQIASGTIILDGGSGLITAPNSSITNTSLVQFQETTYDGGTVNGTILPDTNVGSIQKYTLDGNITLNALDNAVAGRSMTIILEQDGTGGHTLSSTMLFAGGSKTLSTAANAIDIISVFYDGTTYYASLSKGYA